MEEQTEPKEREKEWSRMKRYLKRWQKYGWFPTVTPPVGEDRRKVWRETVTARNQATTAYVDAGHLDRVSKKRALNKEDNRCTRTKLLAYWSSANPATIKSAGLPEEGADSDFSKASAPLSLDCHPTPLSPINHAIPPPIIRPSLFQMRGGTGGVVSDGEDKSEENELAENMTSSHNGNENVVIEIEEEEAGSCEHGRKTPSEYQGVAEKLYITSGLLSIKIHVRRSYPNNGKEEEGADGGRHPYRRSILVRKAPYCYAESILPVRAKPSAASLVTQCPLLRKANAQSKFVPWSHRDMEALEKGLPPLGEGASPWILLFEKYTTADKLALGDIRALIARLEGTINLRALEIRTGTTNLDDEDPFDCIRGVFWEAMRTVWPTKTSMTVLATLEMKPGEEMFQYLRRAEKEWHLGTGERHDNNKSTAVIWRHTVQQGLPQTVQTALERVVGLDNMDKITWEDQLTHFYKIYRAAEKRGKEKVEKMTQRLLKVQLAGADTEADKKQRAKKQLPLRNKQRQHAVSSNTQCPAPGPVVSEGGGYKQPPQNKGRGYSRRGFNEVRGAGEGCYICGQEDHWCRECPRSHERDKRLNTPPQPFNPMQPPPPLMQTPKADNPNN